MKLVPAPNEKPIRIDIIAVAFDKTKMLATYEGEIIRLEDLLPEISDKQTVNWTVATTKNPVVQYDYSQGAIIAR